MKKILIVSYFIFGIFLLKQPHVAFACTPIYSTPQETYNKSDVVFLGRILSVSTYGKPGDIWDVAGEVQVEKYWKGNIAKVAKIKSSGIYTCSAAFSENAKGEDYLIYAKKDSLTPGRYSIENIQDMKLASTSLLEIQALGTGLIPKFEIPKSKFTRDLSIGSTGDEVVALQTWLEQKDFLVMPAGVSKGYFGGITRTALIKYQTSIGIIPAVGYFGPITRGKINITDF